MSLANWIRRSNGDVRGFDVGVHTNPAEGPEAKAMNLSGEVGWGQDDFYGFRGGATLAGVGNDPGARGESGFWGGINTFDANAGIYDNGSMFSAGYNADIINGSVGYRTVDADSSHDRGMKLNGSVGVTSGGLRVHHGDADQDGRPEYGIGLDIPIGPFGVGFDYTTETPVGDLLSMAVPGGLALNAGMDAIGLGEYAPGTVLQNGAEAAWDGVSSAASAVGDFVSSLW